MMHRDLKSPNVLLSEEGVAKIADVAMVRTQAGQEHLISAQPIMTPLWAAPEVLRLPPFLHFASPPLRGGVHASPTWVCVGWMLPGILAELWKVFAVQVFQVL